METPKIEEVRGSRIVQGCLSCAVVLFVVLLGTMLVLAYLRFREVTGPDGPSGQPPLIADTVALYVGDRSESREP